MNTILVEMPRDSDGDKYGMLHLSQPVEECSTLTRRDLLLLGKQVTYHSSIISKVTGGLRKKQEVEWKDKLMVVK